MKLKWYSYRQNNPGGRFKGPALNVHIRAISARVADAVAMEHGIYFDGIRNKFDCECCGNRWNRAIEEYGQKFRPLQKSDKFDISCAKHADGVSNIWIYADGTKEVERVESAS
jgi:hypothetical protein